MPRDIKQVKNVRQSLKKKGDIDQFSSLLDLSANNPSVRNLQWTPTPRVVFCTDEQLNDIIEECCNIDSQSILSIDTTYNIRDFYVTSTTYQSSKFKHTRTGKAAVLPGPTMFHATKTMNDFKYFSHTLLEVNEKFEDIAFIGGDRDKAQQGFLAPLKRAIFLPCKKHVEDDIQRKLSDLGKSVLKDEILKDIFGDESHKEKGIVDCNNDDKFLAKVMTATKKWDALERSKFPGTDPVFSNYFESFVQDDLRTGMLLPVRRRAGLRDEHFYNNAQECANFKFKSRIRESKIENSMGYRPTIKCTWTEAILQYQMRIEEVNREK